MVDTIVLIDADSILYSACYVKKENQIDGKPFSENLEDIVFKFDEQIQYIQTDIEDDYGERFNIVKIVIFIEGAGNFRKWVSPDYKANRVKKEKPPLIEQLKKWVNQNYTTFYSYNVETDDSIVATYTQWVNKGYEIILASIDKDIRTVPCLVWDYFRTRKELVVVTEEEAVYNFWYQMLTGDSSDNIKGIAGMGKVGATKILANTKPPYYFTVYRQYAKRYGSKTRVEFTKSYSLLKMRTDNIYTPNLDEVMF
jgi:DNA polymerase-1